MPPRVALETLGCKVNQYESSYLLEQLKEAGLHHVPFREQAEVYIVHSCAVTAKACFQTRQLLRRAHRTNPGAAVVVTGCAAQVEPERMAEERLATHVLGNLEKFDLTTWLGARGTFNQPCLALSDSRLWSACPPLPVRRMHTGRTRAFLKVQDGCDAFCTYCIVPYSRGKSRSLPREAVRAQMDRFLSHGTTEVVLTGIHLGQWGRDRTPAEDIAQLLATLAEGPLPPRVRLSSLEPMEWSEGLLGALPTWDWICPHFHVPLQSGDGEILQRMGRPYTPRQYAALIGELHALFPDAAIGADVLVGFPGETERHFRNTFELLNALPLSYLHVFPYSPRPGTPAAAWQDRATGAALKGRAQALQRLSAQKRAAFRNRFLGQTLEVLVETEVEPGWWQGTSENYLQVLFPTLPPLCSGALVKVRPTKLTERGLVGEMVAGVP